VSSRTGNKSALARELGVSRSSLYYRAKKPNKDWQLKCEIEKVLRDFPAYGHKRLAIYLKTNKWRKSKEKTGGKFANLLLTNFPSYPNHIWASDFTHLKFRGKWVYLATVIDLFMRKVVGFSILLNHSNSLTINALLNAVNKYSIPQIIHSDNGSEYSRQYLTKQLIEKVS